MSSRHNKDFGPVHVSIDEYVGIIQMRDVEGRNVLHAPLRNGIIQAVAAVVAHPDTRVVLVTGCGNVFCTGAPQALLRGDQEMPFDEYEPFARAFLHCPLPVVAAMQGHAIGGGLVMGLYADVPVLSERSVYAANFLQYAVAPYVGTTHLLPLRMGSALGTEMILTARGYHGAELRDRGANVRVVPHDQVWPTATDIAQRIAQAPRHALTLVKQQLAASMLADTDTAMSRELEPHQTSWNHAEVRQRAAAHYGPPASARAAASPAKP
ncbi:polyketide synthase [Micromonospora sp. CB01531]|uniref:polyketide synthase n=1 Tax=Micromonospora sp. CB01531 TaxID=1718947 RepID=UPI000938B2B7|nr:polyketide synthase [Micromonospora sp. CB01531]OKI48960.1 crotonase [Micromonospora sp. CB01531]